MPEVLTCPSCQRKLQVPEDLLGQDVQCPTCGATFLAKVGGSTAPASSAGSRNHESPSRSLERSKRRDPDEDVLDDYEGGRKSKSKIRRRRRSDYEPHRGPMIMTLGIVSLFFAPLILGPIAWIM